jgi:O-Antigen ligase
MIVRMWAIRYWPLGPALALCGAALFVGGALQTGPLTWFGGGALIAVLALLALRGAPRGVLRLLPLAGLAAWCGASIWWSTLPDGSWDYANRALVYLLFALVGLWLADHTRELAVGLAVLLAAVAVWSLLGKVIPSLPGDYSTTVAGPAIARLRGPVGLWNQLALLGDFSLPLALWLAGRRRIVGSLLAFVWIVALLLTYSRGGLAVAVLVVALWFIWGDERLDAFGALVAAGLPAGAVVATAFALPGITSDGESMHTRRHDGVVFGVVLVAGLLATVVLARLVRPRGGPGFRRALLAVGAVVVAAAIAAAVLKGAAAWRSFTSSTEVGNGAGRIGSAGSNFRWVWWQQAWKGFSHHEVKGTGAGSFRLTNLLYRRSSADTVTEPHDLPIQFLSEFGIVGAVLLAVTVLALLRGSVRRRGPELALALILPAYLLHSLVDVDWDYIAVSGPAFLVAGALAGRAGGERRVSAFAVLAASGAALAAFGALLLPWLGHRWSGEAQAALGQPTRAATLARRARAADPLLIDPFFTLAFVSEQQGKAARAYAYYVEATRRQPANPETWQAAGIYAHGEGCPRLAYDNLVHFTELDPYAPGADGGDIYNASLKLVNAGKAPC